MKNYNKFYDEPAFETAEFIDEVEVKQEPAQEPAQELGVINAREVYIRKGPGKNYESIGTVKKGETVIVLETAGDFLFIETEGGTKAYIMETFVDID